MAALLTARARARARDYMRAGRARAVRGLAGLAWLVFAVALPAPAAAHSLADEFVEAWTTRDGLPHSTINGIGQTADGYLWLATWEGIARYDGHDFHLYRRGDIPGLGDDSVRALQVGPHGDLWAGSARGGIVRWHAGHWSSLPPVSGLVTGLLEEPEGRLWVATARAGVVRIEPDGRRVTIGVADGLPSPTVNAVARDAHGGIWIATSGGLARLRDGRASTVAGAGLPPGPVFALAALPDGRLIAGTEQGAYVGDGATFRLLHPGLATRTATQIWRDADGIVWVGTNNAGLARVDGGRIEWLDTRHGLPNNRVLALQRDSEGSLWVGTNGGLLRMRAAPIHAFTRQDGLADDFVRTTLVDRDGSIWVGSGQGLDRLQADGTRIEHVGLGTHLSDVSVLSLALDARGDVLAGTFHDGVLRLHEGRVAESIAMADGLPSNEVRALLVARDGRLWIGTKQGAVLRDGRTLRVFDARAGLPADFVQALYENGDGAVWVGTSSGIGRIVDGAVHVVDLSATDAQYAYAFLAAADGRGVWVGTDRGLLRMTADGRVLARIDRARGLPFEKIFSIVADAAGHVWITGNEGIAQLDARGLEAAASDPARRVEARLLGRADGMVSAQANGGSGPAAALDRRGRLWVATAIGVARLDPYATRQRALPLPPIVIERFEVDARAFDPTVSPRIAPGDHRIVVRFVAPALVNAQRVRYRYRLEGLGGWVDLGEGREVQFTHLDPRRFVLRLEARVPGDAAVSRASVGFSIEAYWWQRPLVWFAAGALAIALLGLLYGLRIRQLRRTERRLRGLVEERTSALQVQTRIAERLARTDALTMLANRRALDQALDQELQGLADGHDISLMLVDVDGFKPINDLHGHEAGDRALQAVAEVIRAQARQHDVAARWGGDEFALLLVDCSLAHALAVAERVRAAVEAIDCSSYAPGLGISASIGVACSAAPRRLSLRTLIPRADEALYGAKREGRNRVRAAVEPDVVA